jgi:hypothetical protein
MNESKWDSAMFAVVREIRVECQHGMPFIDFGHSNDACISERHRLVTIFLVQFAQDRDVLLDTESDLHRVVFEKPKECILRLGGSKWIASAHRPKAGRRAPRLAP